MKVATIVGTRPEIIRLCRGHGRARPPASSTCVIHTGQNYDYELNEIFFEDLEIRKPDHFLEAAGATAAETIGLVIAKVDALLREIRPDAVLILGDTNSCLAAIAAKRQKIPVFHMEAGNRCFDQRVPEEINRKIVDHIADINLPYSDISREYLLREGLPPDRVIKTGSPMYEVLHHYLPKIERSDVLERLGLERAGVFRRQRAPRGEHRLAPTSSPSCAACSTGWPTHYGLPVIVSTHPRTRKRIDAEGVKLDPRVRLLKPLGLCDYVQLQMHAKATPERQRHDHRGVVDPELPGAQPPRGPRAARGHGRGRGDDDRPALAAHPRGPGDSRTQQRGQAANAADGRGLRRAERLAKRSCESSSVTRIT